VTAAAGDRLLLPADGYGGTRAAAEKYFATLGVQLDAVLAPQWSAKFEWLFVKFQDKPFITALGDGPRSAVTLDDNVVRAGINYRFGGPVVARY